MSDIKLSKLTITGFKSIKELENFEPKNLNILIGPNGAGKSNFIGFFRFLSYMLNSDGKLQDYIAYLGGASDVLHDGPDVTREIGGYLELQTTAGFNEYRFSLSYSKPDRLVFSEEGFRYSSRIMEGRARWSFCGKAHIEARLPLKADNETAKTILQLLRKLIVYQFHNTTDTASIRNKWSISDGRWLKENGANLASFLYRLNQSEPSIYIRIIKYIRQVLPFFDDFVFYDDFGSVLLNWKEKGSNKIFNGGQASDGMLRIIALIAVLAQPPKDLPAVIFFDEPELGLHPAAINLLGGLIQKASIHSQVFVSTQSVNLINEFRPEDIVVVERKERESTFVRQSSETLQSWLEQYTLGQLWEKNIMGGRP